MTELTIVTWKWVGWRGATYKAQHVLAMRWMLEQHLKIPHRFICVTDDARGLEDCETYPIWDYPIVNTGAGRPNCYRRLRVFSKEARSMFGPRLLSIDLDAVVMGDITHLITDDDFKIMQGKAAPYNGSMFLHRTGTLTHVWETFDKNSPDVVRRHERMTQVRHYGSDQAWMSYAIPGAPTWGEADGVYHFTLLNQLPADTRLIFCAGGVKPWAPSMELKCPAIYTKYMEAIDASCGLSRKNIQQAGACRKSSRA